MSGSLNLRGQQCCSSPYVYVQIRCVHVCADIAIKFYKTHNVELVLRTWPGAGRRVCSWHLYWHITPSNKLNCFEDKQMRMEGLCCLGAWHAAVALRMLSVCHEAKSRMTVTFSFPQTPQELSWPWHSTSANCFELKEDWFRLDIRKKSFTMRNRNLEQVAQRGDRCFIPGNLQVGWGSE